MFTYFTQHPEMFWTAISVTGNVLSALIFFYVGLKAMRWLDDRRRATFYEKWFIRTMLAIVIIGAYVAYDRRPKDHSQMVCSLYGDVDFGIESRCENEEATCYIAKGKHSYDSGVSCKFK